MATPQTRSQSATPPLPAQHRLGAASSAFRCAVPYEAPSSAPFLGPKLQNPTVFLTARHLETIIQMGRVRARAVK